MDREEIRALFQEVRPYFKERIGLFTHKRVSSDWYFHAMGFVREEMTYVFGFNLGFFRANSDSYKYAGMSVTVRADGLGRDWRRGYIDFFAAHLSDWANRPFDRYTSEREDEGLLIERYIEVEGKSNAEIVAFMRTSIDGLVGIMPAIVENAGVFKNVVRAEMPWDETLVEIASCHL
ncbi:MAG: hypothetical protein RIS47_519 [Bacteroidota bacterium]|jgi:hypothetical protein